MKIAPAALAISLTFSGCVYPDPPVRGTKALVLYKQQSCHYRGSTYTVTFPAGRYEPAFTTKAGAFYSAPAPLVLHAIGGGAKAGGFFTPVLTDQPQPRGFWLQETGSKHIAVREELDFHDAP